MHRISDYIRQSIQYSLDHRQEALQYALKYARDMDVSLADKFVGMYVNDWTSIMARGREAVRRLLEEAYGRASSRIQWRLTSFRRAEVRRGAAVLIRLTRDPES